MQKQDYGKEYRQQLITELERSKKENRITVIFLCITMLYFIGHIGYAIYLLYIGGLL
jgi:hypothetical protein